jgi:hypothetical protein
LSFPVAAGAESLLIEAEGKLLSLTANQSSQVSEANASANSSML